jgi:hypothetical protein
MPLRTVKAKAARASELLAALKRKARALASGPVLVVYGRGEAASIYYEAEVSSGQPKPGRSGR